MLSGSEQSSIYNNLLPRLAYAQTTIGRAGFSERSRGLVDPGRASFWAKERGVRQIQPRNFLFLDIYGFVDSQAWKDRVLAPYIR